MTPLKDSSTIEDYVKTVGTNSPGVRENVLLERLAVPLGKARSRDGLKLDFSINKTSIFLLVRKMKLRSENEQKCALKVLRS